MAAEAKTPPVGFIGLGVMGKSMARNLIKAGFSVTVHNRSRAAVDELAKEGARAASSPAEVAAASEIVALCLPDTPDVEHVLFAADGVVPALKSGVVIDFSTISPPATVDFARRLAARGIAMLDSPVSGGPAGARDGALSCMIGGDAATLERCMPIFKAVGKTFTHIGPAGAGQLCKACNQLVLSGALMGACEALTMAKKCGVDPYKIREALLGGSAQSYALQNQAKRFLDGQLAPGFRAALMLKDLRLAAATSRDAKSYAPIATLAEQLFTALCNSGRDQLDNAALGLLFEEMSGLKR
jgi:3-hydroxyisobutyrate dehydrogenase-like beta-hydroxyacid dehydrogenase